MDKPLQAFCQYDMLLLMCHLFCHFGAHFKPFSPLIRSKIKHFLTLAVDYLALGVFMWCESADVQKADCVYMWKDI